MNKLIAKHDVIIIGAGPGGTTLASFLAKKGVDVAIIEKEEFPRFKIGESLLPYSMDILKATGVFEKIDSGKYIRKYGAQFIDHRDDNEVYFEFAHGLDDQHPFSFEIERAEFDLDLLNHAKSLGVTVYQPENVVHFDESADGVRIETNKGFYEAKYISDASGRAAFVGQQLKLRKRNVGFNNVAVFGQFINVPRSEGRRAGDIIVGVLPNFCWSWMIPFVGPVTSVGVVVDAQTYRGRQYNEDFIRECLMAHPKLRSAMSDAKCVRPVATASNYSESCDKFIGARWIASGDAATFLDPVFSTGIQVSLKSAEFASDVLATALKTNAPDLFATELGSTYEARVRLGVKRFRSLLRLFYDTDFVPSMKKTMNRENVMRAFTSVVGGDAWNEENELFKMGLF